MRPILPPATRNGFLQGRAKAFAVKVADGNVSQTIRSTDDTVTDKKGSHHAKEVAFRLAEKFIGARRRGRNGTPLKHPVHADDGIESEVSHKREVKLGHRVAEAAKGNKWFR
eukprot:scaffold34585_cov221-Amphora_coffeaeformis.AAC.6